MQIKRDQKGAELHLAVAGRLDAQWAEALHTELAAAVRDGHHHVVLNLAEVSFMSSAGIRVLVSVHKQLRTIEGALTVTDPSPFVQEILALTRLDALLLQAPSAHAAARGGDTTFVEFEHGDVEITVLDPDAGLACRLLGDPARCTAGGVAEADCRRMTFAQNTFAVGLGAFGSDFADCRSRFGEFIAASGGVAYLPADRGSVPDYQLATADFVPEVEVAYCLMCEGAFSHVLSFGAKPDAAWTLSEIAAQAVAATGAPTTGLVIVAETEGLVGAALKRSPALAEPGTDLFAHPQVREWMTFTTEPAHKDSNVLVAGVVTAAPEPELAAALRPLGEGEQPAAHFHAAAFTYRPLRKGRRDLSGAVRGLFEDEKLRGVLHLVNDARPFDGAGQSEFLRGACWAAPITEVRKDES